MRQYAMVDGSPVVYASWNGATETTAWRLLAGPDPKRLTPIPRQHARASRRPSVPRTTRRYYEVQALDPQGDVLKSSRILGKC